MQVERLDLLQFHWWEYEDDRILEVLRHLEDLRTAGKIAHLGLTNFDTKNLVRILEAGFEIATHQVRFSLLDQRAEVEMVELCQKRNVQLLAFGTIGGGFLSEAWIDRPAPATDGLPRGRYIQKRLIEATGGWSRFQQLLSALQTIAAAHRTSIANVAAQFIRQKPTVAAVIIGARLGVSEHIADTVQIERLTLSVAELESLNALTQPARDLFYRMGDCGSEYRGADFPPESGG